MTSRDTVAFFFPDGLVVSRHPVLLCTLDISCFYGSFLFGTGVYGGLINFIIYM